MFFHVNKEFQKIQLRPYLGSRDIDLGFHFDKNSSIENMKNSVLAKSLDILQNKLKFKPVSFRLLKEVHTETEEEITEGQIIPSHFIFPMYIDPLVDFIPKDFRKVFGFQPADEPLLRFAFENKENITELEEFHKKLWLPKVELLLATKINALQNRDKEHKKIKDICDIFALIFYSKEKPKELNKKVIKFITLKSIKNSLAIIDDKDYKKASQQLNHPLEEIKRAINVLIED